jgi:hypothetical protein
MDEQLISNTSYTNKDFRSIYPELLDLVTKITGKWDPSLSNESDPGVILLKLNALIADKSNYNIDKNVLEFFPLSVTQIGNARELYDTLGYSMHWYKSATTQIAFKWVGEKSDGKPYTIPQFSMITDSSREVVYTLINPVVVNKTSEVALGSAIQGVNYQYEINGETAIKLSNLDSDLRLYFTERQIAENGIFVGNVGDKYDWEAVDNLESTALGQKVYKFGVLPNTDICYIQFPQDIANLIEDGLNIQYIISDGVNGNISALTLDTFYNDQIEEVEDSDGNKSNVTINDYISISNNSSALNGSDPEDLDSAYRNYKKTIGTFNTLITCLDYENAIYNLSDDVHPQYDYLVSNCVVSDRTNDINHSYNIQVLNDYGEHSELVVESDINGNPSMTAFNLGLYLLSPMSNIYDRQTFNNSFAPNPLLQSDIERDLEYIKFAQHDYIDNSNISKYLYRNDYSISCKVITYYKVSDSEASQILANIYLALYKTFNAREVDFGNPIDYDKLYKTIQDADTRIKTIILDEPIYNIKKVDSYNNVSNLDGDDKIEIISKSILAGVTPLYEFDDRFNFEFGQTSPSEIIENIQKVTTQSEITVGAVGTVPVTELTDEDYYTLKANESVQLIAPNLETEKNYTVGINYEFTGFNGTEINANTDYKLKDGEELIFTYKQNGVDKKDTYGVGTIILSSFNITPSNYSGDLGTSNSISIRKIRQTDLTITSQNPKLYCYWITNTVINNKYTIPFNSDGEYVLRTGEYFMYTFDLESNELVILGSGTKIAIQNNAIKSNYRPTVPKVDLTSIYDNGISAFTTNDWVVYNLNNDPKYIVTEMQIITLGEGSQLYCTNEAGNPITLNNSLQKVKNIYYKIDENADPTSPPSIDDSLDIWQAMSSLNLNATPNTVQTLKEHQSITLFNTNNEPTVLEPGISFMFSSPVIIQGGENIDVAILNTSGVYDYTLSCYKFIQSSDIITRDTEDFIVLNILSSSNDKELKFNFGLDYSKYVIPIIFNKVGENDTLTVTNCELFNLKSSVTLDKSGTYYLNPTSNNTGSLKFEYTTTGTNQDITKSYNSGEYTINKGSVEKLISNHLYSVGNGKDIEAIYGENGNTLEGVEYVTFSSIPDDFIFVFDEIDKTYKAKLELSDDNIMTTGNWRSSVLVGKINKIDSVNYGNDVLNKIKELNVGGKFNFTYRVNEDELIEDPTLPESFWNIHHIYNKYTIAKLDAGYNTSIQIPKSSKL